MGTLSETSWPRSQAPERRKHTGGCDCGAVRYQLELDRAAQRALLSDEQNIRASDFELLSGEEHVSGHAFASSHVHHFYCERCGVCSFSRHNVQQEGGEFYAVDLRCLDLPRSAWSGSVR
jgi:hypothetical protein